MDNAVNGVKKWAHMLEVTLSSRSRQTSASDRSLSMILRAKTPPGKLLYDRGNLTIALLGQLKNKNDYC